MKWKWVAKRKHPHVDVFTFSHYLIFKLAFIGSKRFFKRHRIQLIYSLGGISQLSGANMPTTNLQSPFALSPCRCVTLSHPRLGSLQPLSRSLFSLQFSSSSLTKSLCTVSFLVSVNVCLILVLPSSATTLPISPLTFHFPLNCFLKF